MSTVGSVNGSLQDDTVTVIEDLKFSGSDSKIPAAEWLHSINARVRARKLTGGNAINFAISNLSGTAALKFDLKDGDAYLERDKNALTAWPKWRALFRNSYCHSTPAEILPPTELNISSSMLNGPNPSHSDHSRKRAVAMSTSHPEDTDVMCDDTPEDNDCGFTLTPADSYFQQQHHLMAKQLSELSASISAIVKSNGTCGGGANDTNTNDDTMINSCDRQDTFSEDVVDTVQSLEVEAPEVEAQSTEISLCGNTSFDRLAKRGNVVNSEINDCDMHLVPDDSFLNSNEPSANTGLKSFTCEACPYSAVSQSGLQIHFKAAHMKLKPINICSFCKFASFSKNHLAEHIKSAHKGLKKNKCNDCAYSCVAKDTLKDHINAVHKGIKTHKCSQCKFASAWKSSLYNHTKNVHKHSEVVTVFSTSSNV